MNPPNLRDCIKKNKKLLEERKRAVQLLSKGFAFREVARLLKKKDHRGILYTWKRFADASEKEKRALVLVERD